ncbi:MAG: thioredoxin [Bacteroidia bacterium]|nr:thioredoxin [Bacteroidia bacterium]
MATIDFQERVIQRSFEIPVVVDFWAAWCGPCRVLGPVITELAKEAGDAWELVKVDTEANQEIAQEYKIYSIPNVKLFHQGKEIAEFTGALPRHQIEQWLRENLPNPSKEVFMGILEKVRSEPSLASLTELSDFSQKNKDIFEAEVYLNWFEAVLSPERVQSWLQIHSHQSTYFSQMEDIKALVELSITEPTGKEPFKEAYQAGLESLKKIEIEEGMKHLIKLVMLNKGFKNDLPRRAMISLFHLMGEGHPLSKKYRPHFSMALY